MPIELEIPVYFQQSKKKKVLASMNWFRNAHWGQQNKYKKDLSAHIKNQLAETSPISGRYSVTYRYFYKNPASDLTNVGSLVSKVLNDSLQELGLTSDDSVKTCVRETFIVADKSKDFPRMLVTIEEEIF